MENILQYQQRNLRNYQSNGKHNRKTKTELQYTYLKELNAVEDAEKIKQPSRPGAANRPEKRGNMNNERVYFVSGCYHSSLKEYDTLEDAIKACDKYNKKAKHKRHVYSGIKIGEHCYIDRTQEY